jgi:hypothetical protein
MDQGEDPVKDPKEIPARGGGAETAKHAERKAPDYSKATPDQILADIEKTRAHMDHTLTMLGDKLHPRPKVKAALLGVGGLLLSLAGWAAVRAFLGRKGTRAKAAKAKAWRWREAGMIEQALLAKKLVGAARKGRPAIIVVEPRKV